MQLGETDEEMQLPKCIDMYNNEAIQHLVLLHLHMLNRPSGRDRHQKTQLSQ